MIRCQRLFKRKPGSKPARENVYGVQKRNRIKMASWPRHSAGAAIGFREGRGYERSADPTLPGLIQSLHDDGSRINQKKPKSPKKENRDVRVRNKNDGGTEFITRNPFFLVNLFLHSLGNFLNELPLLSGRELGLGPSPLSRIIASPSCTQFYEGSFIDFDNEWQGEEMEGNREEEEEGGGRGRVDVAGVLSTRPRN